MMMMVMMMMMRMMMIIIINIIIITSQLADQNKANSSEQIRIAFDIQLKAIYC